MSDLSAFINKKKAGAKKKKVKVDIDALHRKLERTVIQQREEEAEREEREDREERDEKFLRTNRANNDDEWIDQVDDDDVAPVNIKDMAEISESELELAQPPPAEATGGSIDGIDDMKQAPLKDQTFSWGVKPEPVSAPAAEETKTDSDNEKDPVKENPNVSEPTTKFVPVHLRNQGATMRMGTGVAPKVDDVELFPTLGAANAIAEKLKLEERAKQAHAARLAVEEAQLQALRARKEAERALTFEQTQAARLKAQEELKAQIARDKAADAVKRESERWGDRPSVARPPAENAPTAPPIKSEADTAMAWRSVPRATTGPQETRALPQPARASDADVGIWRRGETKAAQPAPVAAGDIQSWARGQPTQQLQSRGGPWNTPAAGGAWSTPATGGAWKRDVQHAAGGGPKILNDRKF